MSRQFWNQVADDVEREYGQGAPRDWKEFQIKAFLVNLEEKVIEHCKNDISKAQRCKVPFIQGRYATEQWHAISSAAFRRIFIKEVSNGKSTTRQQFSIYLGYASFEEYLNKRILNVSGNTKVKVKEDLRIRLQNQAYGEKPKSKLTGSLLILIILFSIALFSISKTLFERFL